MQYQTVYLVVVLICTKGVGMAGRMKVEPSCCVLGAGRTNNAPGAGLKWNAEVGEVAANVVEIRINTEFQQAKLERQLAEVAVPCEEERLGAACQPV